MKTTPGKKIKSNTVVEPYKRYRDEGMHIVVGCVHVPFENKRIVEGITNLIKDSGSKIQGFHIIGDFLDMNSLSSHDLGRVPIKGVSLGMEYRRGNEILEAFDKVLPKSARKTYLYGNHEDRYFRHVADIDNSRYSDALLSPTQGLKLKERGYEVKENWKEDFVNLGKLQLIHGEFCTQTPARTHLQRYKASVMFAHTHRADAHYDGNMAAFNIGWLGDKNAPAFNYVSRLTKMSWINGFGIVHIDRDGYFHSQIVTAFNNRFFYNGIQY